MHYRLLSLSQHFMWCSIKKNKQQNTIWLRENREFHFYKPPTETCYILMKYWGKGSNNWKNAKHWWFLVSTYHPYVLTLLMGKCGLNGCFKKSE